MRGSKHIGAEETDFERFDRMRDALRAIEEMAPRLGAEWASSKARETLLRDKSLNAMSIHRPVFAAAVEMPNGSFCVLGHHKATLWVGERGTEADAILSAMSVNAAIDDWRSGRP